MKTLIETLNLLAAEAPQQIASLPEFVAVTDELALLFCDEVRVARSMAQLMPAGTWAAIETLYATIDAMNGGESFWTNEALAHAPE